MAGYTYERLSAQDSSFFLFEGPNTHMHLGGVMILDAAPLTTPQGGVDIDRIRRYIASRLCWIPRYRQRIAHIPIENYPVWVDDDHFNLNYHVRHTSLPRPGDEKQLKRLCSRIISQQLDRGKPLWEAWIVEGLKNDRFALVTKAHHCMVDGVGGVDLLAALMRPTPDDTIEEPARWIPRPAPSPAQLLRDELMRRGATPLELARSVRQVLSDPERARSDLVDRLAATWRTINAGLKPPAATPLNRPIGPHRRFDWLGLDLAEVKEIKNRLGGTVNDVVLTTVAGAVRRFLERRRVNVDVLDYKVVLPVNRRPDQDHAMGNQVSAWLTALPIQERDPRRRLAKVRRLTVTLKESKQALGAEFLSEMGEWVGPGALSLGVRLTARLHPYNLIVTNVPGPQFPLYMLGAQMVEGYPQVPLFQNQGLGVAIFSYTGKLCWGFNADFDLMPDLHDFVRAVDTSFRELHEAAVMPEARVEPTPVAGPKRAARGAGRR